MFKVIHLFRHGQTDWNLQRRVQGHTDIPLNDEGRKQAAELMKYFAKNSVDLMISSDLLRARETAHIANTLSQVPLHTNPAFREVFLGDIEGLTHTEIIAKFSDESWQIWNSLDPRHFDFAFPRGESTNSSSLRFRTALEKLCREHEFSAAGVCTHGFVLRRFLHSLRPGLAEAISVPNCAVFTLSWDSDSGQFHFEL